MSTDPVEVFSVKDVVVVKIPANRDHKQRHVGFSIKGAHDIVTAMLEAIDSAQGFEDAMEGRVRTWINCPNCKARNYAPSHVCKRVTKKKGR